MNELYAWYHGRILRLARVTDPDTGWRAKLREILAEFDTECRRLPPLDRAWLRDELASRIEHGALQFSDPDSGRSLHWRSNISMLETSRDAPFRRGQ